ncbi:interleukin-17F-like [Carcharodon carcharias]|uniref:interleukin-17F-like n=1 Tax=Carcharodon carcharias TaxID=13397 RepID=UPI001B7EE144|nr:interleukin-17F-like [Carcharodon carcharias]
MLTILMEVTSAAKGRNRKLNTGHPRLRRATKYMLDLENIKHVFHPPLYNWGSSSASFRNRSLSPWNYKEDVDSDRCPSTIFKAECVSTHCLNSRGFEDPGLNTHLVHQEMIVLKRKKGPDHKIIYRAEKMMVPVACVCVRPEVITA